MKPASGITGRQLAIVISAAAAGGVLFALVIVGVWSFVHEHPPVPPGLEALIGMASPQKTPSGSASDIRVEFVKADIGPVKMHVMGRYVDYVKDGSKPTFLRLELRVTNTTAAKKIDPPSGVAMGVRSIANVDVEDEHGNHYSWQPIDAEGSFGEVRLLPGQTRGDILLFERPIDAAKDLAATVPLSIYGCVGNVTLKFASPR